MAWLLYRLMARPSSPPTVEAATSRSNPETETKMKTFQALGTKYLLPIRINLLSHSLRQRPTSICMITRRTGLDKERNGKRPTRREHSEIP
jgi:hypothetical protein